MPSFREILTATDAQLVKLFYRVKSTPDADFIKQINRTARHFALNHSQLVCALGFNHHIRELTDILSLVGFSSYKLLSYRRNELFTNDAYQELEIDNVVDIYSEYIADDSIQATLRELVPLRLQRLEQALENGPDNPALTISYRMEVHAIYTAGIATKEFAEARLAASNPEMRLKSDEVQLMVSLGHVPPGNVFYADELLPVEKQLLIDHGEIDQAMIRNRLDNPEISEDERQMLEDALD